MTRSHARGATSPDSTPFPFAELSPPIADRVRGIGVVTCEDWIGLGRRRLQIFGIVGRVSKEIDALCRVASSNSRAAAE